MSFYDKRELTNQSHQLMDYSSICSKHCDIMKDMKTPLTEDHIQCLCINYDYKKRKKDYCATHIRMCIDYASYWNYKDKRLNFQQESE